MHKCADLVNLVKSFPTCVSCKLDVDTTADEHSKVSSFIPTRALISSTLLQVSALKDSEKFKRRNTASCVSRTGIVAVATEFAGNATSSQLQATWRSNAASAEAWLRSEVNNFE